jgi:hypothetical protein
MQTYSTLPNSDICRTQLVYDELWECLVKYAFRCPHSIRFGNGYYCDHPERNVFNLLRKKEFSCNQSSENVRGF